MARNLLLLCASLAAGSAVEQGTSKAIRGFGRDLGAHEAEGNALAYQRSDLEKELASAARAAGKQAAAVATTVLVQKLKAEDKGQERQELGESGEVGSGRRLLGQRWTSRRRATKTPTRRPTKTPTRRPTKTPTQQPTKAPTQQPTKAPTQQPTKAPTQQPTGAPAPTTSRAPQSGNAVSQPEANTTCKTRIEAQCNTRACDFTRVHTLLGECLPKCYSLYHGKAQWPSEYASDFRSARSASHATDFESWLRSDSELTQQMETLTSKLNDKVLGGGGHGSQSRGVTAIANDIGYAQGSRGRGIAGKLNYQSGFGPMNRAIYRLADAKRKCGFGRSSNCVRLLKQAMGGIGSMQRDIGRINQQLWPISRELLSLSRFSQKFRKKRRRLKRMIESLSKITFKGGDDTWECQILELTPSKGYVCSTSKPKEGSTGICKGLVYPKRLDQNCKGSRCLLDMPIAKQVACKKYTCDVEKLSFCPHGKSFCKRMPSNKHESNYLLALHF